MSETNFNDSNSLFKHNSNNGCGFDFSSLFKYKSYYEYDFESETIQVAEGDDHEAAQELYAQITKDCLTHEDDKWAFDIALDCIRNMTDEDCARIKQEGEIPMYHFGYGMYVRNRYVHPSEKHTYIEADMISSRVEDYIYAILLPVES